jgi:energy-coupling factor transporter ATP-binding protein EcfA2
MSAAIEVILPDGRRLPGEESLVIIGPNGSGKTRLGAALQQTNTNIDRIPALRNLELSPDVPMAGTEQARQNVMNEANASRQQPWRLANELNWLMAQLLAEDAESAKQYRDEARKIPGGPPPETKITRLVDFWNQHFPGRAINLSTYRPVVRTAFGGALPPYPVQQMSDGERAALYVTARVLNATSGLILVDEPEVHFHSLLARRLWTELELLRPDCRFIYITHDLAFALSRRSARFIITRAGEAPEILDTRADLPSEVIEAVLGAASFSVAAKRLVFCEGDDTRSIDEPFYQAWFDLQDTAVLSVGSSEVVKRCVQVLKSGLPIKNAQPVGIVDRDYWDDATLKAFRDEGLHVLDVHELESLLCIKSAYLAVAAYLNVPNAEGTYEDALAKAKNAFQGAAREKQVLERAKRAAESKLLGLLNTVAPAASATAVKTSFVAALDHRNWGFDPSAVFDDAERTVAGALAGPPEQFLRILPGKTYLGHFAQSLGVSASRYLELIVSLLSAPESDTARAPTKGALAKAFAPYLPPAKSP